MNLNISLTGLAIQCVGMLIVMGLSFFMTRSIKRTSLEYWTIAWVFLAFSLLSLSGAFGLPPARTFFFFLYYFTEYVFGLLFIAGCRNFATGEEISRKDLKYFIAFVVVAAVLAFLPIHYNKKFIPHFAVIALLFWQSYKVLSPIRRLGRQSPGMRVMSVALILLTINFLHYVPVFSLVLYFNIAPLQGYLGFTSIYDMLLETLLAFGTVMLVMEDMRSEVEATNRELMAARDRLETLARIDPLTEAFNRHAFYSMTESKNTNPMASVSGNVVVIDIDNLKPINDKLGHTVGDSVIREVATALRSVIRAEDMLFRWGGDEFLILLFNSNEESVKTRMSDLVLSLENRPEVSSVIPIPLRFSYGISAFSNMGEIEQAIDRADSAMYQCKDSRKSTSPLSN
jgi:diguanylate cyclase (GGDEF)-like protein